MTAAAPGGRPTGDGMRKYVTLLRLKISLAFFFPMALGYAVVSETGAAIPAYKIVLGFLAFFCAAFFASTLNFYADVASDKEFEGEFKDMDLKRQPFVTGEMGRLETALAFALSGAGCVACSLVVSLRFAVFIVGFALVVGLLYSHPWFRLKAKPVTDMLCNILGMGFSLMAGLALAGSYTPPAMFLVWAALFITVVYIPTVVNDVPFDEAAGYKTSGVFFGASRLLYSMVPLTMIMIPLAVLLSMNTSLPWLFRLAAGGGTLLAIFGVSVVIYRWHPPRIELNPDVVLYPMDLLIIGLVIYGSVRLAVH
jgi:4-hydroxybenzoate polyprenyltransferase